MHSADKRRELKSPLLSKRDFRSRLQLLYIDGAGTFRTFFGIKADCITLGKGLKPLALDGRIVDKNVCTVFVCNKAVTFRVIEPLHCST